MKKLVIGIALAAALGCHSAAWAEPGGDVSDHGSMNDRWEPVSFVPRDAAQVASVAAACNGEPRCMAAVLAAIEAGRCQRGVFVEGGCLGPNGELMKWMAASGVVRQVGEDLSNECTVLGGFVSGNWNGSGC